MFKALTMASIPHDNNLDNTLSILKNGYDALRLIREENKSNVVTIRLMGMPVICLGGEEGARIFYDPERFQRSGAVPKRVQKTLTGENAIHTQDGDIHQQRKDLFLSVVSEAAVQNLMAEMSRQWELAIRRWTSKEEVVLFTEVQQLLCRAVCAWAGVPLPEEEVEEKTNDFAAMVDAFGAVGPRHWRGKRARSRAEEWITGVIEDIRNGTLQAMDTPAAAFAFYKENGELLNAKMAAVELLNSLRPTVAISWYIVFAALALHQYPECGEKLKQGDSLYREWFVQEVRRYYPFAPFMGALVRQDFTWQEYEFKKGTMVFLDIHGINHDPEIWSEPAAFRPERFADWNGSPFNFVPQGGGYPHNGHRCPGEGITIEATKLAVDFLVNKIDYKVPQQDLSYSLQRMPTYPESGFVIREIRLKF